MKFKFGPISADGEITVDGITVEGDVNARDLDDLKQQVENIKRRQKEARRRR